MPESWRRTSSSVTSEAKLPVVVRRHAAVRTMRLAIDPRDGTVRLTLPRRASVAAGLKWVESKRGWIEQRLAAVPPALPLAEGTLIPFDGIDRRISWREEAARGPTLLHDTILIGGDPGQIGPRLLRWLRSEALAALDRESRAMATAHELTVARVRIGDPRSRWASCSASGDLRYSWRLIMAPPEVRRSVVAHELAHRWHMDHSAAFHAAVVRLFGRAPRAERAWLRHNQLKLHRVGR